ncbi:MAG: 30S ribosomal protein S3 [Parcubacteria group bacterium GW2011_GWC1_42_11]|uniref:Small ribosomal subunit protein uS3 n=2 Tax=root TaxID=1 RepID=A0A0G0ZHG5_9BACT|nr:30S ribosomal protein S3 [uncultured organism]KKS26892.1 MAG: 30S ribosomal protein S3 [Parcubacteria group bacterium GW2011_GWC1_42_11]KKS48170.1 MAG: 30S ribosomal protein S3 [Candidatus Nomurabacteria bacterium GW2011_GWC2_42_20]KKS57793.1 MAG: 30S ribosomal protein S3 [Candidatus Nomurabacteria bacterium GW2011_GWA2_42_41]KKT08510.1 MAG: 30S ribosomal protein S3 [Candidatus Nomurabacteria bacterium GW2011_GWB1_43_20]TAN37137.1 MAG: 30S ribosomal protein S3 [Patescibacteria group bacteri
MTHIVHPYAHRLGIIRDWKSRWFGAKDDFKKFLKGDVLIRKFLDKRLRGSHIAGIEIERNAKTFRILIKTARPGMVIGRAGEGSVKLKNDILKEATRLKLDIPKDFKLDIEEVRSPESNAGVVAEMVCEGLEKRLPFRMVLKQTIEKVMANRDVKGARIAISGRLGGAEMARYEQIRRGGIPLQTFRADIDFAKNTARLPYGAIGVKVWIYKGQIFADSKKKLVVSEA